ncbi:MAG: hypothetical protein Q9198_007770, partial [Flavoplaca austrocitrina]
MTALHALKALRRVTDVRRTYPSQADRLIARLELCTLIEIMSDYDDDDMDVDDQPVKQSLTFSSNNTNSKGKRSAANLPVEAEDSTGKTSTILALARRIYGPRNIRQMVLELNASDDRGIDVVREQIKTFASTKQIFTTAPTADTASISSFKLIILDEADAMTSTAQMALRRIMEKYTANTRFCIIANYTHKLSPALLSRCTRFRFSPLKEPDIRSLVDHVIENENIKIQEEATESLVRLSKGDMRRALNVLQACHASSTPLHLKNQPPPSESSIQRTTITNATIYDCIAAPHPSDIALITDTLLQNPNITSCLNTVNMLKSDKGLALADILTAVSESLAKLEVPPQTRVAWLDGMAEIEYRLSGGGGEV